MADTRQLDRTELTEAQEQAFWRDGFVILPGVLSAEEARHYRRLILDMVPRDLTLPESWTALGGRLKPHREPPSTTGLSFGANQCFDLPDFLPLFSNERVYGAAAQLLSKRELLAGDGSLSITLRNDEGPVITQKIHLDPMVPPEAEQFEFSAQELSVGGCYYLSDVRPRGGGIHVVRGGHRLVEERARSVAAGRHLYGNWRDIDDFPPSEEVVAHAGDFVMTHHLLPHAASNNFNPEPRVVQFTRFVRTDHRSATGRSRPAYNQYQLQAMDGLGRKLLGAEEW